MTMRALWLVRDATPAQISDADRRMMARWLRATADYQTKKDGEAGARVIMSAASARTLAEMLDTSPATAERK